MRQPIQRAEQIIGVLLAPLIWRIERATDRRLEYQICAEMLGLLPMRLGMLIRRVFYKRTLPHFGSSSMVRLGSAIVYPESEIGERVRISNNCTIGLVSISDDVIIAHGVSILSGRHHHRRGATGPIHAQEGQHQRIRIGTNVWIGAKAIVMADVGDNVIVGAGAVVVRPVPSNVTVVGNPAHVIRTVEQEDRQITKVNGHDSRSLS